MSRAFHEVQPRWLVLGAFVWMTLVSVVVVVLDLWGVVAVVGLVPALVLLDDAREDDAPKPGWLELGVVFVPIGLLAFGTSYVFDTTRWAWLAPFLTVMAAGSLFAEHIAARRRQRR